MPKRTADYHSWLIKKLTDPHQAERYLRTAMKDSPEIFLKALRNVAEANKMAKVAEEASVNRESLYRALSEAGNPTFRVLNAVLDALGMELLPSLKQTVPSNSVPPSTPVQAQAQASSLPTVTGTVYDPKDLAGTYTTTNAFGNLANEAEQVPDIRLLVAAAQISQRQEAEQGY